MEASLLPESAGSIVEERADAGVGTWATLAPTTWDPRTHTFSGLVWCMPGFRDTSFEEREVWPASAKKLRGGRIIHVGPAPKPTGKRPFHRLGTVALLEDNVYTLCPMWVRNGQPEYETWLNPATGVATEDVERHGTELVAGLP